MVANQTVNLTIPTFPQPTLVTTVNNWIVMQQRIDLTSFNLAWSVFKSGFGTLNGNFWLGLEKVYQLTKSSPASLRIEMFTTTGKWFSAEYAGFILDAETNKYAIHLTGYSGDSSDIMSIRMEWSSLPRTATMISIQRIVPMIVAVHSGSTIACPSTYMATLLTTTAGWMMCNISSLSVEWCWNLMNEITSAAKNNR